MIGASTLATQLEKFRHAPDGITRDARDKLFQMAAASLRVYRGGPHTAGAARFGTGLPQFTAAGGAARVR